MLLDILRPHNASQLFVELPPIPDVLTAIFHDNYNVGTGKPTTVNYIAKKLGGKKIFIPKRPGEPDKSQADIKKINRRLKWKPKISLDKGIKLLLQNINDWKQAPVWTPKKISVKTRKWFKYLK